MCMMISVIVENEKCKRNMITEQMFFSVVVVWDKVTIFVTKAAEQQQQLR